jgi:hypothetical protein
MSRSTIRKIYGMQHDPHCSPQPMLTVAIDEDGARTYAKAELHWRGSYLAGMGVAYLHPSDYLVLTTGQELATARALSDLANQVTALARVDD